MTLSRDINEFRFREHTIHFIWCCHAVRWGIWCYYAERCDRALQGLPDDVRDVLAARRTGSRQLARALCERGLAREDYINGLSGETVFQLTRMGAAYNAWDVLRKSAEKDASGAAK